IARERREEDERLLYVALTRARGRLYLPWPGPGGGRSGPYQVVDRRLDALLDGEPPPGFTVVEVPCASPTEELPPAPLAWPPAAGWPPPPEAFGDPTSDAAFAALRRQRGGRLLTSYSRVRRG